MNCRPRYFTVSAWGMTVWLILTTGQWPFRRVNVIYDDLDSIYLDFSLLNPLFNAEYVLLKIK
jgi:hypothetical protein